MMIASDAHDVVLWLDPMFGFVLTGTMYHGRMK